LETNGSNAMGITWGSSRYLWATAEQMRGHMMLLREYKHVALGLIFYSSTSRMRSRNSTMTWHAQETDYTDPEDRDEYWGMNVFLGAEGGAVVAHSGETRSSRRSAS
jgi:type I restriction enzyme M protein